MCLIPWRGCSISSLIGFRPSVDARGTSEGTNNLQCIKKHQFTIYNGIMNNNGRNKKILCKTCYKEMRGDNLTRHMKQHSKINENNPVINIPVTNKIITLHQLPQHKEAKKKIKLKRRDLEKK